MIASRAITACRYCGSGDLTPFLSLGAQPPSNSFLRPEQIASEQRFPLDVGVCASCHLVQLLDTVPPDAIFDDYLYRSSSSKALVAHYGALAARLRERFHLQPGDVVVDIGANDGILLNGYGADGLVKVGVEPSKVGALAPPDIHVIKAFFGPDAATQIVRTWGRAKVVTATNVFPHVDDISTFTHGLAQLLDPAGVFVIEAPYLIDLIDQTLFDTIYHEHLAYLSLTPLAPFLARHGLTVFDVERVPFGASGPAIRVFSAPAGAARPVSDAVGDMLAAEKEWGVDSLDAYRSYARKVEAVKERLLVLLQRLAASGARIGGYGAPAKGNTLLNYAGITPALIGYIAEANPVKQGLVTPGSHVPIISDEEFLERMPEYALLLPWNYAEFFLKNSEYVRRGGKFVIPIPEPSIAP